MCQNHTTPKIYVSQPLTVLNFYNMLVREMKCKYECKSCQQVLLSGYENKQSFIMFIKQSPNFKVFTFKAHYRSQFPM